MVNKLKTMIINQQSAEKLFDAILKVNKKQTFKIFSKT